MKKKILDIIKKKNKSKIVSLTAYSKNVASILDNFCDIILVGDSLGSVLYNYKSTREVSLKTMIDHSKSVRMGIKKSLMVVDMPHNTYRNSKEALKNSSFWTLSASHMLVNASLAAIMAHIYLYLTDPNGHNISPEIASTILPIMAIFSLVFQVIGGILGAIFTIPLRKTLIIRKKLKFPEGIATSKI